MKIRNGFVSNSSSSSFIVKKRLLTDLQIKQIYDYYFSGQELGMNIPNISREDYQRLNVMDYFKSDVSDEDKEIINNIFCYMNWGLSEISDDDGDEVISGFTIIDNFDMSELFNRIGIDNSIVKWEE